MSGHAADVQLRLMPMKPPAAWLELSLVGAALTAGMLAVMWASGPDGSCTMPPDAARQLVLSRETDREHLANDLATAHRVVGRHMRVTGDGTQQDARSADCEATLVEQIATRHGLPPDLVRSGLTDAR